MLKVEHPNYQPLVSASKTVAASHQESRSRRSRVKTRIIRSAPGGRHWALGGGLGKIYRYSWPNKNHGDWIQDKKKSPIFEMFS